MIEITNKFPGGNIEVISISGDTCYVKPELRDTEGEWFYWAFKVSGAEGKTIKFIFNYNYVGYYGAAVSLDCRNWHWQYEFGGNQGNSFTYTFAKDEKEVYFAHNYVYLPDRLSRFAKTNNIELKTLCKSERGRDIPYIKFGEGDRHIILTSRHHACESTGSYVLEGVLEALYKNPIPNTTIFCVPMVDYDGVLDGDQGKNRTPHDHNRDYYDGEQVYASTREIKKYANENRAILIFDFHSPWHISRINDKLFIVRNSNILEKIIKFSQILENQINDKSLKYFSANDMPANTEWNRDEAPSITKYLSKKDYCEIAVSFETCYFGEEDNIFSESKAIEFGKCYAEAIRRYMNEYL